MNLYEVIKRPLITEKGTRAQAENSQYVFQVDHRATKYDIRAAVEMAFNVKVANVNSANFSGKWKRVGKSIGKANDWKKAVVTLKPGEKIEFFEGV